MRRSKILLTIMAGGFVAMAGPVPAQYVTRLLYVDGNNDNSTFQALETGSKACGSLTDNGSNNTAFGCYALFFNGTAASYNTGFGVNALESNSGGSYNTATGAFAMSYQSGSNNTATGYFAIGNMNNPDAAGLATGSYNTASGSLSLASDMTGSNNTADGYQALFTSTADSNNTASGYQALYANNGGSYNAAFGSNALYSNLSGGNNTASGYQALYANSGGSYNAAFGAGALFSNLSGNNNTASGPFALSGNTTGSNNTAAGYDALANSQGANNNSAFGAGALFWNHAGNNTAIGYGAVYNNKTGANNTVTGYEALYNDTAGGNNVAYGYQALYENTASGNAAIGYDAMYHNKGGGHNSALGFEALFANTSGAYNIALGYDAGYNLTTGSNNIDIGSVGGSSTESGIIRIGTLGTHAAAYLQGVYGVGTSATPVFVDSNGQLTAPLSSERFKSDVTTMGEATQKLGRLRPVTFHYETDAGGTTQYGLVAEEVALVYPELVIRGPGGRIDGVRYDQLAPMLLNEVQQQKKEIAAQSARNDALEREMQDMQQRFAELKELTQAAKASQVRLQPPERGAESM